jgi:hypothetical protein
MPGMETVLAEILWNVCDNLIDTMADKIQISCKKIESARPAFSLFPDLRTSGLFPGSCRLYLTGFGVVHAPRSNEQSEVLRVTTP